jgi:outer membrane protein
MSFGLVGCQSTQQSLAPFDDKVIEGYETRQANAVVDTQPVTDFPKLENRRPALVVGSLTTTQPSIALSLEWQMPDPSVAAEVFAERSRHIPDERRARDYQRTSSRAVVHLKGLKRAGQIRLGLAEAIHRTLANSYAIRVAGYEPAVSTAQIVEAEALFDATFYTNWMEVTQDEPTASSLQASSNKMRTVGSGIRKLLSTGTQVDMSYNWQRIYTNQPFQTLNPAYTDNTTIALVQPLLRGFGIDFNRSQICIRKNERKIAVEKFRENVREILLNVEQSYWQLVQARRTATVIAELLAETEETYRYIEARRDFDAFAVLIANSKSAVEMHYVDLITAISQVKEAEDTLKALMNDPELNLSKDIELVTVDIPEAFPLVLDRLAEVQTALDNRSELKERELEIDTARIIVGTAKNQALPKFDAIFQYKVNGLGPDLQPAFEQMWDGNYIDYQVGVQFEWPIGNRKARAQIKQAKLRYEQAIAGRKAQIEKIILEVNTAVRQLQTAQEAIKPALSATLAAEENVRATKERAERKSPSELQTELSGQENLAQARRTLLGALIRYNIAIASLERAKGRLLPYNNVMIAEPGSE